MYKKKPSRVCGIERAPCLCVASFSLRSVFLLTLEAFQKFCVARVWGLHFMCRVYSAALFIMYNDINEKD